MEKIIRIDNQDVKFKATGATIRLYRQQFQRDMLVDMAQLNAEYVNKMKKGINISRLALETFENVAYIMAKQADETIADNIDEWLDGFSMFTIYNILPEIIELWNISSEPQQQAKKKGAQPNGK